MRNESLCFCSVCGLYRDILPAKIFDCWNWFCDAAEMKATFLGSDLKTLN